mgnify:CR=1 FL=1
MLDDWFCKYKVTATNPDKPACGRLDPVRLVPLFTEDTKAAVENCKEKAQHLSDPLPMDQMHQKGLAESQCLTRIVEVSFQPW